MLRPVDVAPPGPSLFLVRAWGGDGKGPPSW